VESDQYRDRLFPQELSNCCAATETMKLKRRGRRARRAAGYKCRTIPRKMIVRWRFGAQRQNKTVSGVDCGYFIPVGDCESGHGGSNPPVTAVAGSLIIVFSRWWMTGDTSSTNKCSAEWELCRINEYPWRQRRSLERQSSCGKCVPMHAPVDSSPTEFCRT
jgi:hypothetical protein